ncbi:MAG: FmdB family transcriptional regulator [SAR202 cluster bacterium]|nr:FmdB family transcriptional regulator [SAR202 cluster bacterium]
MPLYDYQCAKCRHVFELKQSFTDEPVGVCPRCSGRSRRKFRPVPIIYKGSGFYTTDYARSSVKANGTGLSSDEKDSKDSTKESSKTETKAETKSEAKTEAKAEKTEKTEKKSESTPAKA